MARRGVVAGAVAAVAAALFWGGPAGAAPPLGDWAIVPTSGPAGTQIKFVSQTPCPTDVDEVLVQLVDAGGNFLSETVVQTDADNNWFGTITVSSAAAPGNDTLEADCQPHNGAPDLFYENLLFTVTTRTAAVGAAQQQRATAVTAPAAVPGNAAVPVDTAAPIDTAVPIDAAVPIDTAAVPVTVSAAAAVGSGVVASGIVTPAVLGTVTSTPAQAVSAQPSFTG